MTNSMRIILVLATMLSLSTNTIFAQERKNESITELSTDTIRIDTARVASEPAQMTEVTQFIPDPTKALWYSALFPGLGQVYNRKYWKLPILYAGFAGTVYALNWNNQYLGDYSQAYLDIMDNDPLTNSYVDLIGRPQSSIDSQQERYARILKQRKDYFRRNRDLSIICMVGVYLLGVVDAYVDAQLFSFDISPDLSMQLEPTIIAPTRGITSTGVGLQCAFKF
ncbi:MAG: DUF5683 domain-containing protein [Bacteroidales bacterium]